MAEESLKSYRTARIRKYCENSAMRPPFHHIEPGERYLRAALPPNSDIGNIGWWTMNICKRCMTPEKGKNNA